MPFVYKKSKSIKIPIGSGKESMILKIKRLSVEKILSLYEEHTEFLEKAEDAKIAGKEIIRLPINLMRDLKNTILEAAVGWENVVDEAGNPIIFSRETLEEIISYDMSLYMEMMQAISHLYGTPELDDSEKNSSNTSGPAAVH